MAAALSTLEGVDFVALVDGDNHGVRLPDGLREVAASRLGLNRTALVQLAFEDRPPFLVLAGICVNAGKGNW